MTIAVKERPDTQPRPKPIGHEDLISNWVGAGHLKTGDKIKQADGTTGVVANVTTIQQTHEMFNLTVDEAHTFYVGTNGWLVHNGCGPNLRLLSEATFDDAALQMANGSYEIVNGIKVFGNKAVVNGVYTRNIFLIEAEQKGATEFGGLVRQFEGEAAQSGAKSISIFGAHVINPTLNRTMEALAKRYGYEITRVGNGNVILTKTIK